MIGLPQKTRKTIDLDFWASIVNDQVPDVICFRATRSVSKRIVKSCESGFQLNVESNFLALVAVFLMD